MHCIVWDNGDVRWFPPAQFSVLCNLNLKYWPFDTQKCELIFGSWTYAGDQIDIMPFDNQTNAEVGTINI